MGRVYEGLGGVGVEQWLLALWRLGVCVPEVEGWACGVPISPCFATVCYEFMLLVLG